jgi:hypothetical protein
MAVFSEDMAAGGSEHPALQKNHQKIGQHRGQIDFIGGVADRVSPKIGIIHRLGRMVDGLPKSFFRNPLDGREAG